MIRQLQWTPRVQACHRCLRRQLVVPRRVRCSATDPDKPDHPPQPAASNPEDKHEDKSDAGQPVDRPARKLPVRSLGGFRPPNLPLLDRAHMIGGLGAYTGFLGTMAIVIAAVSHLDLYSSFRWGSVDLDMALGMTAPLLLLNMVIMLPNYGNWKLPLPLGQPGDDSATQPTRFNGRLLSGPDDLHAADTSPSSTSASPTAQAPNVSSTSGRTAGSEATSASAPSNSPARSPSGLSPSRVPAAAWGSQRPTAPGAKGPLRLLQDALHLTQGAYVSRQLQGGAMPQSLVLGMLVLNTVAVELLHRGVALPLLADWVSRRMFEAGMDDAMMPIAGPGSSEPALWIATGLMASVGVALAVRNALAAKRRLSMFMDLKTRIGDVLKSKQRAAGSTKAVTVQVVVPNAGWAEGSFDAVAVSAVMQGGRDVLHLVTLNAVYIASGGNLAASLCAAMSHQLAFAALQRVGSNRLQQRSSLMMADLKRFNERLQQRKQLPPTTLPMSDDLATRSASAMPSPASPPATAAGSSRVAGAAPAPAHDANSAQPRDRQAPHSDGTPPTPMSADSADTGAVQPNNRIGRSLSVLDMLIDQAVEKRS